MHRVGYWDWDQDQFPVYHYTGGYPVFAKDKLGHDAKLPEDPCFLLGNYRATVFVHVSGSYEFITGERGWARLNHGGKNKGWNQSIVTMATNQGEEVYALVGGNACEELVTQQTFGIGYANLQYNLNDLKLSKVYAMQPSMDLHNGNPSLLLEVSLTNSGDRPLTITYQEQLLAHYMMMNDQNGAELTGEICYRNKVNVDAERHFVKADICYEPLKLQVLPCDLQESYTHDIAPPSLFMKAIPVSSGSTSVSNRKVERGDLLCAQSTVTLAAGEQRTLQFVIGLTFENDMTSIANQIRDMFEQAKPSGGCLGAYTHLWRQVLPSLVDEPDVELRCEMIWNAYCLEAMATYSQYFGETYIPQGSVYAYHLGENASNRDHLQHCLPLIYTHPQLAKSCLRYAMKHSARDGEIKRQNIGFGYSDPGVYMESDAQLYMFQAVSEYLRVTRDYSFLNERVTYYPVEAGWTDTVLTFLMKHFIYLRDVVGRGRNGLIRMLNSDWSDSFFHPYSPNIYKNFAQSHVNTSMALAIFPPFLRELTQAMAYALDTSNLTSFIQSVSEYHDSVYAAYMKDMEGRTFSPRCYLGEHDEPQLKFGMDTLCIEPQPFLLQVESFPVERKRQLLQEIQLRVLGEEKYGARTREVPLWGNGDGEDGGVWFAHQGPLIVGIASFDREEAVKLMRKLMFHRFAEQYPDYWVGHWTFADSVNSSLSTREGLYSFWVQDAFHPFCAHVHAWQLYCYYRVYKEMA
ncbi:hypothetical protein [Paenibacillus roseipurpureus]|uniref:Glycosyl hydrolase 36 catalytic domain-containing protein n=1 Tax=Paenibacillus roseopurpureus TaxID=2918901 RepID=A0AA96RIG9_9BACL|nr:hypothetical protein [Paenibacillus sp. MBLB1832]WNR42800.1 hypothetical protein MJB10_16935 [Paenibacillus sp. MBLB1832]